MKSGDLSVTDAEFLSEFEACTLPPRAWTHEAHLRAAYLYASRFNVCTAIDVIRERIQAYNAAEQVRPTIRRGYHETITVAFMRLVAHKLANNSPMQCAADFLDSQADLLNPSILRNHYSQGLLSDPRASSIFVPPDRLPLPDEKDDQQGMLFTASLDNFQVVECLSTAHVEQLHALTTQQWWGKKRTREEISLMLENTSLLIALIDRSDEQLVGFCRVLTDFAFRATLYDVMIAEHLQGQQLGRWMLNLLFSHPRLQRVNFIYLACEPKLASFYENWGCQAYRGKAEWMIKIQHPET